MLMMSPPNFLAARIALTFMAASLAHDYCWKFMRKIRAGSQRNSQPDSFNDHAEPAVPSRRKCATRLAGQCR
jgi:hypothetical protein